MVQIYIVKFQIVFGKFMKTNFQNGGG